jgi:hypothetical protein
VFAALTQARRGVAMVPTGGDRHILRSALQGFPAETLIEALTGHAGHPWWDGKPFRLKSFIGTADQVLNGQQNRHQKVWRDPLPKSRASPAAPPAPPPAPSPLTAEPRRAPELGPRAWQRPPAAEREEATC